MLKEREQWPSTRLAALQLTFIPSKMEDEGSLADGVTAFYVSGNFANCLAGCKGLVDQEGKGQVALVKSGEPVYTSEGSTLRVYPVPEARRGFLDRLRTQIRNARQKSISRP
ncbi:hypothetical protein LENED_009947 [Lentinula edodes]|uniref:Uncharacterized protein n=1 Tax=Lentinula edodes TaxID=5353 RepID=A0A1Q3EL47_LENED|nr:uncharacterized protein C8R40DRAFT_1171872 [Lentinula edodes]KAH7873950.1 hypothetical protein C8R40DRAFT_1171872 [Lentinula edodes]GAW07922.1 hypothetical protein LENED_009947 [Lentinula edodes]